MASVQRQATVSAGERVRRILATLASEGQGQESKVRRAERRARDARARAYRARIAAIYARAEG